MSDKTKISVQIRSLPVLLTVAFVVLKLCNVITWSWWWVLAPIWVPTTLSVGLVIIVILCWIIFGDK